MIRSFLDANFLLRTDTAVELYRRHAEKLPVADYHTRLRADLIAANEPVADLTTLWLDTDPDKWRLMRAGGVSEDYISGNRTPYEKFEKWAEILPQAMRHPIYHQAHMELNRVFGIGETLKPSNARDIYESCTAKLQTPEYLPQAILRRLRIETLATTDDPADSLNAHLALRETGGVDALRIIPTWAPDRVLDLRHPEHYNLYLDQLAAASDTVISTYNDLLTALRRRHKAFGEAGCVATLHRLTTFPDAPSADDAQVAHEALRKVREGGEPTADECLSFHAVLLRDLAEMDAEAGRMQMFHVGTLRDLHPRLYKKIGPDAGFDAPTDRPTAEQMARFFARLDADGALPETIVSCDRLSDAPSVAGVAACFAGRGLRVQYAPAGWHIGRPGALETHLDVMMTEGLVAQSIGFASGARTLLAPVRHEYFRRVICDVFGREVEQGLLPHGDLATVKRTIENICSTNARRLMNC